MYLDHIVLREGRAFCEFPAQVKSFPHHDEYAAWSQNIAQVKMNAGGGIIVDHDNYPNPLTMRPLEIRLDEMHSIELWVPRDPRL